MTSPLNASGIGGYPDRASRSTHAGYADPGAAFNRRWPSHTDAVRLPSEGFGASSPEVYRQMRRKHGPVVPVLLDGDVPAWLVLGYREVVYAASNPALFGRDSRVWNAWDLIPSDWALQPVVGYAPSLRSLDGPEHERRSGAVTDVLAAVDPLDVRKHCARIADGLIDAIAGRGRAELMADYVNPIPLMVSAGVSGMPAEQQPMIVRDLTLMLNGGEGSFDAQNRIHGMLSQVVALYRADLGTDLISGLVAHPARLTDEEIVEDTLVMLMGGQAPTADWIGNTLRLMLTDPRFAVDLSGGRLSVGRAMTEVLWEDSPAENVLARWARRDTQLAGHSIRTGDLLIFGLAAANVDPQVRPDPYDGAAGNQAHLSFSHGEHRCPYPAQETAEILATTAIEVLLDRLPDLELAVPPEALAWRPSAWSRGLAALPVRFTPM